MTEALLCLVVVCFLVWVILLSLANAAINAENRKLRAELDRRLKMLQGSDKVVAKPLPWGASRSDRVAWPE